MELLGFAVRRTASSASRRRRRRRSPLDFDRPASSPLARLTAAVARPSWPRRLRNTADEDASCSTTPQVTRCRPRRTIAPARAFRSTRRIQTRSTASPMGQTADHDHQLNIDTFSTRHRARTRTKAPLHGPRHRSKHEGVGDPKLSIPTWASTTSADHSVQPNGAPRRMSSLTDIVGPRQHHHSENQ